MQRKVSDLSTLVGIIAALAMMGMAMHVGGSDKAAFIDLPSLLIVVGGTFSLTIACFSWSDFRHALASTIRTISYRFEAPHYSAIQALSIAEAARKRGILELEKHSDLRTQTPFFQKAVRMVIDGMSPQAVEKVMLQEIHAMDERHTRSIMVLRKAAELAPAMGLIGTLIGLVQMLGNLNDPSSIGPAMAIALLTTFYGAVIAYAVFSPLATKLERNTRQELLTATIYLKAAHSMAHKENPRQLELVLNSILPPAQRVQYFTNPEPHENS